MKNANSNELSKTRKRIRLRAKFFKNEYFKAEAAKINQSAINRDLDKLFSRAKKQESTLKPGPGKCPPEKIFDHFKKHFNPTSLVDSVATKELSGNLPEFVRELQKISNNFPINHEVPTIDETQKYLRQLKSGKASNDVDPELLKKCEHALMLQVIYRMANNLWSSLDILGVWGNSRLKALWKGEGSKSDPSKYRGPSIRSTVCMLTINIILERIRPWYEAQLSKEQNGGRKNRCTTDGIDSVKGILQISNRKKLPLYLLFVDLTAIFDRIPKKWMFDSIRLRILKVRM